MVNNKKMNTKKRWFSRLYHSTIYSAVLEYMEYNTQIGNIFFRC